MNHSYTYFSCLVLLVASMACTTQAAVHVNVDIMGDRDTLAVNVDSSRSSEDGTAFDHGRAQVEWIRSSKGGFVHEAINIVSGTGMFTTMDIAQGDTLMVIPRSCLLTSGIKGSKDTCDTVHNLLRQHKLGDQSPYAAYVKYNYETELTPLPSAYSDEGKRLFQSVLGSQLPVSDTMTTATYEYYCGEMPPEYDPEELQRAHYIVLRRSWDDIMIPVFDMVNHRNGRWTNVDSTSAHLEDQDIRVYATRDIAAGEQLYLSYNECTDCDFALTYVTEHMVRDFGFVEQYPQRWMFLPFGSEIVFDLDIKDPEPLVVVRNDTAMVPGSDIHLPSELQVTWRSKDEYDYEDYAEEAAWGSPDEWPDRLDTAVERYLRQELARLESMRSDMARQLDMLRFEYERDTISRFYEASTLALQHAIRDLEERKTIAASE